MLPNTIEYFIYPERHVNISSTLKLNLQISVWVYPPWNFYFPLFTQNHAKVVVVMMIDKLKIVITNSHSAYIFQSGFIFLISFDGRRDLEAHPVCFFVIFQNASGKMNVRHKMNQCKHRYIVT